MRTGHKVLVCGGRDFSDAALLDRVLCAFDNQFCIGELIHGGAKGADSMAGAWAKKHDIPVTVYPADWNKHGKRAGPLRNEQMLSEGKPDYVLALPGGRGTSHMVRIAKEAGVPVILGY
jgi:hypothetical protein